MLLSNNKNAYIFSLIEYKPRSFVAFSSLGDIVTCSISPLLHKKNKNMYYTKPLYTYFEVIVYNFINSLPKSKASCMYLAFCAASPIFSTPAAISDFDPPAK